MKKQNNFIINRIATTLREKGEDLYATQVVAIKNSKSWGQLAPGLNAILIDGNLEGFLWSLEETTYNRYGGCNHWTVVYAATFQGEYNLLEEEDNRVNSLYLQEGETTTTITFGRRDGKDYSYVLTDRWGRPTKFSLLSIEERDLPWVYSFAPRLSMRQWNGERTYRDIFVPKKVLYPYAEDNEPVLCCTYINNVGFVSAYWDGEMVSWKKDQQPIYKMGWCFLPKTKQELIDKINSKEEPVEEIADEEEYCPSSVEERPRRKRRTSPRTTTPQE